MQTISDKTFNTIINSDKLVLVDFWADWCRPCKQLSPILEEVSNDYSDKITIFKANIDENEETSEKYGIRSLPTLMIFKNNEMISSKIGSLSKSKIIEWIESIQQ